MDKKQRPSIPTELRRRVLIEAGHRCAIPTCRYIDVDVHHIVPWERCKKHEYKNLIALCPNCHKRAERGEIDRKSLRRYKANLRFVMEKYSQFEMDVLFELHKVESNKGLPIPPYLRLLIKRILDAEFIRISSLYGKSVEVQIGDISIVPDLILITDKGREFIASLGIEEIGY